MMELPEWVVLATLSDHLSSKVYFVMIALN